MKLESFNLILAAGLLFSCSSQASHSAIEPLGKNKEISVERRADAAPLAHPSAEAVKACSMIGPDGGCLPPNCPANSPTVNTFPLNGIDSTGSAQCSEEGIQVLSLVGGGSGSQCAGTFSLIPNDAGNALMGRDSNGNTCEHEALIGAKFDVRSDESHSVTLRIDDVKTLTVDGPNASVTMEGYKIVRDRPAISARKDSDPPDSVSLCDERNANALRRDLNRNPRPEHDVPGLPLEVSEYNAYVIVVPGPIYSMLDMSVMAENNRPFFNLACYDDALAKRTFYGLYDKDDPELSLTSLRMLTANYCGRSYTVPHMNFTYKKHLVANHTPFVEAHWKRNSNVTCLQTPRLTALSTRKTKPRWPDELPDFLLPSSCGKGKCGHGSGSWESWTKALLAECAELSVNIHDARGPNTNCDKDTEFDFDTKFEMVAPGTVMLNKANKSHVPGH